MPNNVTYTYDHNGNLTSDGNRYFGYDDENQLTSVWATNAWRSEFVYDGKMRRRVRREYVPLAQEYVTNQTLGALHNDFTGLAGMQIVVGANPITVTALGRMLVTNSNHLSHTLKLVNASDGSEVLGGSVSLVMNGSAGTVGQYQYMALNSPVVLAAGATYYLVSQESTGGDYWDYDDTTVTTTSVASETASIWSYGDGVWHTHLGSGHSYIPVNFKYLSSTGWMQADEVHYIYDGGLVVQERDVNLPAVTYTRGRDLSGKLAGAGGIGGLLARTDHSLLNSQPATAHAYYHSDASGNITALINSSQAIAAKYLYDPFGNIISQSGLLADANLYRFSSKELHKNSGLAYYLYRYYDPTLQCWLNRDPLGEEGGINLYEFVGNEPPNGIDAFGLYLKSPSWINCLGYASGQDADIQPDPSGGKKGNGESLKEVAEKLGYKCSGPTTKECKAKCDQDVMVIYIYDYRDNPDKKNPWKDPWIHSPGNDFHAIRGQCGQWSYVGSLRPKGYPGSQPQPTPDPTNPDSYWNGNIPKQRYCCIKKK